MNDLALIRHDEGPLQITRAGDMLSRPPPDWLIYQVIPRQGLGLIYGPTRSGKSFLGIDLAHHLALGREWFGRPIDNKAGVLYCASEAPGGLPNRFKAWWKDHGISENAHCPVFCCESAIDLRNPHVVDDFAESWSAWGNQWDLVIVDTLSCAIPGADENKAEDMSQVIHALKGLRDATNSAVILIHHTPKSDTKAPRGSTVLEAGVDVSIQVERTGDLCTATVRKQREGEEGPLGSFRLHQIETGLDSYARPVTSCVIESTEAPAEQGTIRLTPNEITFLTLLQEAMPRGLIVEEWNARAREIDLCGGKKQRLYDLRISLKRKGKIHTSMDCWYVTKI